MNGDIRVWPDTKSRFWKQTGDGSPPRRRDVVLADAYLLDYSDGMTIHDATDEDGKRTIGAITEFGVLFSVRAPSRVL